MNTRLLPLIPAVLITVAGVALLSRQRAGINSVVQSGPNATAPALLSTIPAPAASAAAPGPVAAPARKISGDVRAAAFLAGLEDRMRPLIEKSQRNHAVVNARHLSSRTAVLLKLTEQEQEALRRHLESQPVPGAHTVRAWLTEFGTAEQLAVFNSSESARRTAQAEHDAQEAIFRLSRIVDLTPEQKDKLFDGFVSKASAPPVSETSPMELRTLFSVKDAPDISNPSALARPLLTPEQLTLLEASIAQETAAARESEAGVMGELLPALLSALAESGTAAKIQGSSR